MGREDQDGRSFLDGWSVTALVVLVLASYGPAAIAVPAPVKLPVLLLGLAFLASTVGGARVIEREATTTTWALVFGAQLGISFLAAVLAEGRTLLSPVATISLAVLYLPARPRVGVISAVAALIAAGMFAYAPTALVALQAIVGLGSAAVFVGAFSQLALSRHRARAELARANTQLRAQAHLTAQLAAHEERLAIARDIHDSVGHWLTSAHVHLEAAKALVGRDEVGSSRAIESAAQATREALAEVRRSVRALRSEDQLGAPLAASIGELVGEASRTSGIAASFRGGDEGPPLPPEVELALFRVTQEALTNVRRHARALHVAVSLERTSEGVVLIVEDDGEGLPARAADEQVESQGGLRGIEERVVALGGSFTLRSAPGDGTRLRVEVPA